MGIADVRRLKEAVCEANLRLVEAGLVVLTWGNVSAVDRERGLLAIKPSGVAYGKLRPEDIALVELESGEAVDSAWRPSSDTPTHRALYRAWPGIGAVVHTHSAYATSWAQARREIPCLGTTHADHFEGAVPVCRMLDEEEIESEYEWNTGRAIVESLEKRGIEPERCPGILVPGHGPFSWGKNAGDAVDQAIALEAIAQMASQTLMIEAEAGALEGALHRKHFNRKHGPGAYYGQAGEKK